MICYNYFCSLKKNIYIYILGACYMLGTMPNFTEVSFSYKEQSHGKLK